MDREILFRGFYVDENGSTAVYIDSMMFKGEWVYGYYWLNDTVTRQTSHITDKQDTIYVVLTSTLGQYTGLKDKNGKKIFEGDVLSVFRETINKKTNQKIHCHSGNAVVKYGDNTACFLYLLENSNVSSSFRYASGDGIEYEVVGTKFDGKGA